MVRFLQVLLFLSACAEACAQNQLRNLLYIEAGGNGFWGSLNYEYGITNHIGLRAGIGIYTEYDLFITTPLSIHFLVPIKNKPNKFVDLGLGFTWTNQTDRNYNEFTRRYDGRDQYQHFIPSIGFRKNLSNNWMWRFSLTPAFLLNKHSGPETGIVPWAGFSIGKRF